MKLYSKFIKLLCLVIITGYAYPATISAKMVLDIKANGQGGSLEITQNDPVIISASLTPGLLEGTWANLWCAAYIPSLDDWYSYVWPDGWVIGLEPMGQEQLYGFTDMPFLYTTLPVGNYIFVFAVDTIEDPILSFYDSVEVSVIDSSANDAIISDPLTNGKTIGKQQGGTFENAGWRHTSPSNKISYQFSPITSGRVSFDVTNISNNSRGGGDEYDIYFGIYDDASGDKEADYTGAAFIEIRFNYTSRYPEKIKILSGAGKNAHEIDERLTANMSFDPQKTYKHEIVFGNGKAEFYLNGQYMITTTYNGTINWRSMFIGDTNYKGQDSQIFSGMEDFIYSNVTLKAK